MEAPLLNLQSLSTGVLLILAAAAMIVGGVVFVGRAIRMRRELMESRVNLVASAFASTPASRTGEVLAASNALMRNPDETPAHHNLIRRLAKLGISPRIAPLVFAGSRLVSALGLGALALALGSYLTGSSITALPVMLITAMAGIVGGFVPTFVVRRLVKAHTAEVAAGLPEALELLVICAEAGLALGDGIDRIVKELRPSQPALAEELAITAADLKILPSRDQALANFAERIDLPGVHSLVTTLSQSMRYGTPLAQAMRVVAAEMRNESLIHLEERANRLPALLTVPMMLFIMPTIFLVVGGPAALKLLDVFGH